MKTHLLDRTDAKPATTVCRLNRAMLVVISVQDLLNSLDPCPKCLEWMVEQGQLAGRRLLLINETEPHL